MNLGRPYRVPSIVPGRLDETIGRGRLGDRYRLIAPVGQGGMSVVWHGHDDVLDRRVAVKLLAPAGDDSFRPRLRDEARAFGRLNTPTIAQVYDYGEATSADGARVPYVVMEFVDGQPLSHLLGEDRALPWPQVAAIGADVAAALEAAHAEGVVHRDIKPGNVMITRTGTKVIDFGISATIGAPDRDGDGTLLGTAAYLAPERLSGGPVSPAADVYALGVLLYRALTGHLPPPRLSAVDGVDPRLVELCRRCLDPAPDRRPTSTELAREFGRPGPAPSSSTMDAAGAVPVEPSATRPYSTSLEPLDFRPGNRRRLAWPVVAAVAVLLLALVAVGWTLASRSGETPVPTVAPTCRASFTVTQDSGTRFSATIVVTNTSAQTLSSWTTAFAFSGDQAIEGAQVTATPDSGTPYPATVRQTGSTVVIEGAATRALPPHQSVRLPIAGRYGVANPLPTQFRLNDHACDTTVAGAANPPARQQGNGNQGNGSNQGNGRGGDGHDNSGPGGGAN